MHGIIADQLTKKHRIISMNVDLDVMLRARDLRSKGDLDLMRYHLVCTYISMRIGKRVWMVLLLFIFALAWLVDKLWETTLWTSSVVISPHPVM